MFNQPLPYKFVQTNKNKYGLRKYDFEHIFKFFVEKRSSRRKIIVEVKQYSNTIFTVDFYATVASKERDVRNLDSNKYRYMTNLGRVGSIGATIFAIIGHIRKTNPDLSFGFQAANLVDEDENDNNKRFRTYEKIMSFVTGADNSIWEALAFKGNSYIFVIQKRLIHTKEDLLITYGSIFGKIS